ncbi:MAG: PPC domain-containing protein [Pirellulaceae bacterium]|nr:PPC domain-containing protein [Pirellulaceae bacterium]
MMARIGTRLLPLLLIAVAIAPARAVEPAFASISPLGVQRGTEVEMTFGGQRLADIKQLLFYSPGFEVKKLEGADASVKATIAIAPDCRLGIHAIRLATNTGISNLKTFTVGNLPEVKEVEPNTLFTAPQIIPLNVTVSGSIGGEDVDHFVVELKKGDRLTCEIEALRLGNSFFDPYVAILNEARFELTRSDDAALLNQDCLAAIIAPEDGKYIVQVRETSFGSGSGYRLHVGSFPRPTAAYPGGGKPGETLQVRWIGDVKGEFTTPISLPADGKETAGLIAQDPAGFAPSPNVVRVIDLPNALEAEPNDEFAKGTASGAAPLALNGIIEKEGDIDFFKFSAKKGQQLDVRMYARKPLRSPLDGVMFIHNDKGSAVANNDDTGGPDSYVRFNVPADGDYYVSVRDQLKNGGADYVYRIELTEIKPSLSLSLPERVQYISTTLTVPKNNRMALMVGAQRTNFAGDLTLSADLLPPGMKVEAVPMPGAMSETPVLFVAASDAQPTGALIDLIGKPADEKVAVVGHMKQRTMLVRGANNSEVWGHEADRVALSLADEIPFQIDVVQPKAPLPRNGSINLKVVAKRAEGFTAPISVKLLYNPPGVASSTSINIPEGKNEADIPLTANGGAGIGNWKIVVLGRATHGGGSVECSSQFVDLTVAEQFYKLTWEKAAVEQGLETEIALTVEKLADFPGAGKAELAGLPNNTSSTPIEFTKDTAELVFKIAATKDARPGRYPSLVCVTSFQIDGETVSQTIGGGEVRVDAPLPPKPNAPPAAGKPATPAQPAPAGTPMKRLSRLEQLRLEKEKQDKK